MGYVKSKDTGVKFFECPECGSGFCAEEYAISVGYNGFRYCPYCGKEIIKDYDERVEFKVWCLDKDEEDL